MDESVDKLVTILVSTNSKTQKIEKISDDKFKIRLTSKPMKGKANKELIEILSKFFGVYKEKIEIISGKTSKRKKVMVHLYKKFDI